MAAYSQHDVHIWEDKLQECQAACRSRTGTATGQLPLATSQADIEAKGLFSGVCVILLRNLAHDLQAHFCLSSLLFWAS